MALRYFLSPTFLLICCQLVRGVTLFNSSDELPQDIEYDFVVVGGGTAGNVVASRLGENPDWKILVVEAGPSSDGILATHAPGLFHELLKTPVDWNFTTTNQPGLNGRNQSYGRARMLGGCSAHSKVDGMVYTRGSRDDWDRWAKITGEKSLGWDNMLPLIQKAERFVLKDSENQNETGHIDPSVHGTTGGLAVTAPYVAHVFDDLLIQTTTELTEEFPYKQDMNDGRPIGISWNQFTIDEHAERSSSATAYLEKTGQNVHALINTFVTRVLPVGNGLDFRGVELAVDSQGSRKKVVAKKEVILSGGIFGSAQVLLNSGIGARQELEMIGIKTLVDNPSVGKNFTDQPAVLVVLPTTLPNTDFDLDEALAQWNSNRTGPLIIANHLNNLIWVRLSDDAVPFDQSSFRDPTAGGTNSPHVEFSFAQISSHPPATTVDIPDLPPNLNTTVQMTAVNLHPISRGSVSLNSTNPFGPPVIDLGILTEDLDVAILREGIRSLRRMYSSPAFKDSVSDTVLPAANVTTDEDLDAYIRSVASPWLHGIGTAAMSPRGASWGVVDPDFRVKGTKGLRVVDASVLPDLPSGHTQAPTYGMAELASVMITGAWND